MTGVNFDPESAVRIGRVVQRVEGLRPGVGTQKGSQPINVGTNVRLAQTTADHPPETLQDVEVFYVKPGGSGGSGGAPMDAGYTVKAMNRGAVTIPNQTGGPDYIYIADFSGAGTWDILTPPPSPLIVATLQGVLIGISTRAEGDNPSTGTPVTATLGSEPGTVQLFNPIGLVCAATDLVWAQSYGDGTADAISGGQPIRTANFSSTITPGASGSALVTGFGTQTVTDPGNVGALAGTTGLVAYINTADGGGGFIIVFSGCPSS